MFTGILGSIGSLIGGLFGNSAANKRQTQMLQWQERMDNTKIQRLQADAKAAGVHPIAAMGGSLTSPTPVNVGGTDSPDFSGMGQNIGRAIDAQQSSQQKNDQFTKASQALTLQNMDLKNDVIRTQLANSAAATVNAAGNPPTFASSEGPGDKLRDEELPMGVLGNVQQSRKWSPQEKVENEYGDIVGEVYGLAKWIRDVNRHTKPDGSHPVTARYWREKYNQWRNQQDSYRTMNRRGDHGYY